MATTDNLLSMTQSFMTPEIVQKFSGALSQSPDTIKSGLKTIVPTFLMGLVNKGSSSEGAESLVRMAKGQGIESPTTQANLGDENYLQKGNEAVNGIFGNNLSTVTSTLASTTGMNTSSVTKMMGMIAPVVMGVLGKKISSEGMNANGLMNFLGQQKSSLSSFLPSGLTGIFGAGAAGAALSSVSGSAKNILHKTSADFGTIARPSNYGAKKKSWVPKVIVAAVIMGIIWWLAGNRNVSQVKAPAVSAPSTVTLPSEAALSTPASDLGTLGAFFKAGNVSELPKRFSFQNLKFDTGTATLAPGAEVELDQIAAAMKEYPKATSRIEGFTDNTGSEELNQALSQSRAEAVKQQLVSRQIDASRIEAVGRGSASPIAENTSEAGKAQNRRIEFIATGL